MCEQPEHERCRACGYDMMNGRSCHEDRIDGLCSYAPQPEDKACYGSFVDYGATHGVEVRHRVTGHTHSTVNWSRPEVQVLFDQWLDAGRPVMHVDGLRLTAMPF